VDTPDVVLTPVVIGVALLIGVLTGLLSGTFGVGGGIVCTPMLRLFLQLDPHDAVGTTLALIVPTSMAGSINYVKEKLVNFSMVKALVLPGIIGIVLGAYATTFVHGQILMICFSALIALAGLDLVSGYTYKLKTSSAAVAEQGHAGISWMRIFPIGLLTGLLAGFFGVGGGFILIPILLSAFNMNVKSAFGTSLLVVACLSIPGAVSHTLLDHVQIWLVLIMACGAVPGSMIGSKLALKLKDSSLRTSFGAIMLFMAAFMAYKELNILVGK